MSINEKYMKDYEDSVKKILNENTEKIISRQSEIITQIGEIGEYFNLDKNIPNMGITFNNKLNELSLIFKKVGISMFAEHNEKYDFVGSNFVGDAIIEDIIAQLLKGTNKLSEYDSSIRKTMEKDKKIEKTGSIKKIFLKIRSLFIPTNFSNSSQHLDEKIAEANSHLSEYKEIDENLWKYNLKDDLVQSIVKHINNSRYDDSYIPKLLEESVIPTLQKLELEDVIPKLQEEARFSDKKSWKLSSKQMLETQESSKKIANKLEQNKISTEHKEDKEYID